MSELVRCPSCRGSKKVAKLGGVIGDCNTCDGEGKIKACDKPVPVIAESLPMTSELIKATAQCVPVEIEHKASIETLPVTEPVKVDGKRAIYKRKTASK